MHSILLVGADQSLLRTRAAVLAKTGAQCFCSGLATALTVQSQHACGLVILCHTLPDQAGVALTRIVHERWPGTAVLQVIALPDWGNRPAALLADSISTTEPERLLKHTRELLGLHESYRPAVAVQSSIAYLN